jgi:putative hydrolase of the HAD superfamily
MKALIFDFDGLIADTESAIYEAWQALYATEGQELPLATYQGCVGSAFGGFNPMTYLESLVDHPVPWDQLLPIKDARIEAGWSSLSLLPGIADILHEAQAIGVPCAVASSSFPKHVLRWIDHFQLRPLFQTICCRGDEGAEPKPAPDLFLLAARRLGVPPESALVLEDSRNGLLAAQAAGIPCLVIPSPVTLGADFRGACAVWPSLAGQGIAALSAIHS